MSKYEKLWQHIAATTQSELILTFAEIEQIAGVPIDHSFLRYKKELIDYGWQVKSISLKSNKMTFVKK
ncbi:MAG: hypothetical protein MJ069_08720 [Salinivirgaceae bacterium]|nr:hypothetical protein [Salinivirgaceae bacterium]